MIVQPSTRMRAAPPVIAHADFGASMDGTSMDGTSMDGASMDGASTGAPSPAIGPSPAVPEIR